MKFVTYEAVDIFLAATESDLLREETKHGLLLELERGLIKTENDGFGQSVTDADDAMIDLPIGASDAIAPTAMKMAAHYMGDLG